MIDRPLTCCMLLAALLCAAGCGVDPNSPEGRFAELFIPRLRAQFDGKPLNDRETYQIEKLKEVEPRDENLRFHITAINPRVDKYAYTFLIDMRYDGQTWTLLDGDLKVYNRKSGGTQRLRLYGSAGGAEKWDRIKDAFNDALAQWTP